MISYDNGIFGLYTEKTSYLFAVTQEGHLEHIHYGARVEGADASALRMKNEVQYGSSVAYRDDASYSLDTTLLEYSGIGKGDYRHSPIELIMPDGSFVTDFVYESHEVIKGNPERNTALPFSYGADETLILTLADKKYPELTLALYYSVYEKENVVTRSVELKNGTDGFVYIRKLMSFMMDLNMDGYDMMTLDGSWGKEAHLHRRPVTDGILVNDSTTGSSSNRHNPAFLLLENTADDERGRVYGFNLVYSGNHYSAVEKSPFATIRVMSGINPHCFLWRLSKGESFVSPEAVMSYGEKGINSFCENMHAFVNEHIVRGEHKGADRPIVLNNWEATFFNFNRRKLHSLAARAKKIGVETFVLDDGWFGQRNSDTAGLGDYSVNEKKLPGGIAALAKKINKMGMKFGLWFEPECVNEDSDLYRAHPEYALKVEEREVSRGRHQLVLDLTRADVRDYVVDSINKVLSSANIEYVKWDYNRHISDMFSETLKNQGELYHRYILGLYEILDRIFVQLHPNILLESCSSGGNRFDLGMLCYSPQIWTSDNTDPIERLEIQGGIYTFYPPSTVSAHVSMAPHQQTLRDTPLSTRFNVSAFGVLGYELDLSELTSAEMRQIKEQISFYKDHRRAFQYGRFSKVRMQKKNQLSWQIKYGDEIIAGLFQTLSKSCDSRDVLRVPAAEEGKLYRVSSVRQYLRISRFGSLIKHITPIYLRPDGFILRTVNKHFALTDGQESYECTATALRFGINLAMQYVGTGYHKDIRVLGDFGSNLYLIQKKTGEKENG